MLAPGLLVALLWAPAADAATIVLNETFGDHMVLQREPSRAALYGMITYDPAEFADGVPQVTVTITDVVAKSGFKVNATVTGRGWKAILPPRKAGGNFTLTVDCGPCDSPARLFDVTFGDVWYCSGQSNMWLPLEYTYHRNESVIALKNGSYPNIRGLIGNSQNKISTWSWMSAQEAVSNTNFSHPTFDLFQFSAVCYYFAESLTDRMIANGEEPVPFGLICTAIGGSMIEEWTTNKTTETCSNYNNIGPAMQSLFDQNVVPFIDMTVKGFLWYQGENNDHGVMGNAKRMDGYGCQMTVMINEWRSRWSQVPNTTDPLAPFGICTLAAGNPEGGLDIGAMRWSQSGNYGVAPNHIMENVFLAQAYDLGDPWPSRQCYDSRCCDSDFRSKKCTDCVEYCEILHSTNYFMGPIHPRLKKPLGDRLAEAAHTLVYKADGYMFGPTIDGCRVESSQQTLRIRFGSADPLLVKPYKQTADVSMSSLRVLVNASLYCVEARDINGTWICQDDASVAMEIDGDDNDDDADAARAAVTDRTVYKCYQEYTAITGQGMAPLDFEVPSEDPWPEECWGINIHPAPQPANNGGPNPYDDPKAWVTVNITLGENPNELVADLSPLQGASIYGVRYAWGNIWDQCCENGPDLGQSRICPPASCPVHGAKSGLPANPFMAKITEEGICECNSPQDCSYPPAPRD